MKNQMRKPGNSNSIRLWTQNPPINAGLTRKKKRECMHACKLEAFSQEQLEDKLRYVLDLISKELKRYKFIQYGEERRKDDSFPEVSFHFSCREVKGFQLEDWSFSRMPMFLGCGWPDIGEKIVDLQKMLIKTARQS